MRARSIPRRMSSSTSRQARGCARRRPDGSPSPTRRRGRGSSGLRSCRGSRDPRGATQGGVREPRRAGSSSRRTRPRVPARRACRADAPRGKCPRGRAWSSSVRTSRARHVRRRRCSFRQRPRCCSAVCRGGRAPCTSLPSARRTPLPRQRGTTARSMPPGSRRRRTRSPCPRILHRGCGARLLRTRWRARRARRGVARARRTARSGRRAPRRR